VLADVLLGTVLVGWLAATVLHAGRPGAGIIARLGGFGYLVPVWNFFAPNPAIHDYHLLYRDRLDGGTVTAWHEAPRWFELRPWFAPLWNPDKVYKKALFDLTMALDREAEGTRRAGDGAPLGPVATARDRLAVQLSAPYLHLLEFVSCQLPHEQDAITTQFAVVKVNDLRGELVPLFLADHHRLDRGTAVDS
jgi:hypothetical protein